MQAQEIAVPDVLCPKCAKALVDPDGLGWCSGCGYCKSLEDKTAPSIARENAPGKPSVGGIVETASAIRHLPIWFWVLLVVVSQGIVLSVVAGRDLPPGNCFQRALWATLQIAAGLLIMFLSQCWVLLQIAPEESTLAFKDALFPFKLWPLAFKRLPKNQISLWAAAFGFTIVIGAFACVGGLEHWLVYVPSSKGARPATAGSGAPAPSHGGGHPATVPVD